MRREEKRSGERVAGQRRPALLLLKAPSSQRTNKGRRVYLGILGGWAASQMQTVGPGPGWGGEKRSKSQNGDAFWNQSQQDLLMNWTWEMSKEESCHAHLQVSGLSTWVDGGAFPPRQGMTGVGVGRSRDGIGGV